MKILRANLREVKIFSSVLHQRKNTTLFYSIIFDIFFQFNLWMYTMQTQVKPGLKRKRGCSYSLGETKIMKDFLTQYVSIPMYMATNVYQPHLLI